ncbi:MAG: ATP synthase F1 subunit delta [Planctomycetota bacterium]|nr:ATP synthase F1 subunit delta [Planctomycetota bacterium]MCX8039785.1 ATP synthase F1 subunit delta [Planctomycetota bacterium]MDW8373165.1 ATP synthase F1 subunit delta [Planctomycetota bacterium]
MAQPATVPGVYAESLLAVAEERGVIEGVVESCQQLSPALGPEVVALLDDPRVGPAKAKSVLRTVLREAHPLLLDLLCLLVDRHRLREAPAILAEILRRAEQRAGVVRVAVTTAQPLSAALRQRLIAAIGGQRVQLAVREDPSLLGGLTIRIGDCLVDGSARRHLKEMHQRLINAPVADSLWAKE